METVTNIDDFSSLKENRITGNPKMSKTSSSGITYYSFDKAIIKIVININATDYTIITGHAMSFAPFGKTEFDYPESYTPLEELIKANLNDNLIVLGDFNTEKIFEFLPEVRDSLKDVINAPTTKEYFEKRGEIQIDYILLNNKLKSEGNFKIDNFSDHYIVGANVTIK